MTPDPPSAEPALPTDAWPHSALGTTVWLWAPVVAVMVGIFLVSGIEDLSAPPGGMSDKTGHAIAYGLLGVVTLRATSRASLSFVTSRSAALAWIITVAYGASDEFHQRFVSGRFSAWDDWVADALGAALAIALVAVPTVEERRRRKV